METEHTSEELEQNKPEYITPKLVVLSVEATLTPGGDAGGFDPTLGDGPGGSPGS